MLNKMMKLKLQLFTEGAEGGAQPEGNPGAGGGADNQSFDDLLANKEYQAEFDRRINKALETAKGKWETETANKVKEAQTQAQRFAQMTDEERATEEEKQRLAKIEEREQLLNQRELKVAAIDVLAEKGLPIKLADVLHYSDENTTKAHIDSLSEAFAEAVQAEVDKRLAGSVDIPTGGGTPPKPKAGDRGKELAKQNQPQQTKSNFFKN